MLRIKVIFLICAILINCISAYLLKNKMKCGINENECERDQYNNIIQELSETGFPDAAIPVLDPYEIKNLDVVLMGMIKVAMPEGIEKGFKTCSVVSNRKDIEKLTSFIEMKCEVLAFEGKYNIQTTPTLDTLIGGIKVHGEGQGGIQLENLHVKLEIPFEIRKLDDSELHYIIIPEKVTYSVENIGKLSTTCDNLYVGSQEISSVVVNIVNENWKFFFKTFEKSFFDLIAGIVFNNMNKFFASVSVKDLTTDDLSPYVTH